MGRTGFRKPQNIDTNITKVPGEHEFELYEVSCNVPTAVFQQYPGNMEMGDRIDVVWVESHNGNASIKGHKLFTLDGEMIGWLPKQGSQEIGPKAVFHWALSMGRASIKSFTQDNKRFIVCFGNQPSKNFPHRHPNYRPHPHYFQHRNHIQNQEHTALLRYHSFRVEQCPRSYATMPCLHLHWALRLLQ